MPQSAPDTPAARVWDYDRDYFLSDCEGHASFVASGGRELSPRLIKVSAFLAPHLRPGDTVLEIGPGRGELLHHLAGKTRFACGCEYSAAAVSLARETYGAPGGRFALVRGSAAALPFRAGSFDTVVMVDVLEHLTQEQLLAAFTALRRLLRPGGQVLIHTQPNRWCMDYGYPLFRLLRRLKNRDWLPRDPRRPSDYALHINEHSPRQVSELARQTGFACVIELHRACWYPQRDKGGAGARLEKLALALPLVRAFFCREIFARFLRPAAGPTGGGNQR